MYSYQHKYHAGNFADIHKHVTLLAILKYLKNKDSAFCVIDAFAGEGIYNLKSQESSLNQEHRNGYSLLSQIDKKFYLFHEIFNKSNNDHYLGSPFLIKSELREQDRGIFIENHKNSYETLWNNFSQFEKKNHNIMIYRKDSYDAMNALVPYKEKRGIVFIDPSYEIKTEYNKLAEFILKNFKKNSTGIYIIWYPLINKKQYHNNLLELIDNISKDKIWHNQIVIKNNKIEGMYGSGIILINPPWTVDLILEDHFIEFTKILNLSKN